MEINKILEKQTEILSHQKNFNLLLVIVTTFLVLIYALDGAKSFSRYSSAISEIIVVFMIVILFLLALFIIKQKLDKKVLNLFGS